MDDDRPNRGASGSTSSSGSNGNAAPASLSIVRAGVVLIVFVVAVALLVGVGTRPSVSSTASTTSTTAAPAAGTASTTTTVAAAGGGTASSTTTTAASRHGHSGGTTTTTAPHSATSVVVANATSTNGLAAHYSSVIGAGGWTMKTPIDASTTEATSAVYYATGQQQEAASIATTIGVKPAQVLPISTAMPVTGVTGTDVVVVIGQDLASASSSTTSST